MEQDLASRKYMGRNLTISWAGIALVERSGIVDPDVIANEIDARARVLSKFGQVREKDGPDHFVDIYHIPRELDLDSELFERAFSYHRVRGHVAKAGGVLWKLTSVGTSAYRDALGANLLLQRFLALESDSSNPQVRGHQFEAILADMILREGWSVDKNVLAVGEENDLVIFTPDRMSSFLVSCKWEKESAASKFLLELRAKMNLRPGTEGIFMSMSGFSEPLVVLANDLGQGLVHLFGPNDVRALFEGESTFASSLLDKRSCLIKHRKCKWS